MIDAIVRQSGREVAEHWASVQADLERAEDVARRAKDDVERLRNRLTTLSEQLMKRVGPNIPTKVFKMSNNEAVVVQYGQPIKLLEFETEQND